MRFTSSIFTRWAKLLPAIVIALTLSHGSHGQAAARVHIAHCVEACPQAGETREVVVHHLYAAAIDPGSRLAEWVAYRVLGGTLGVASLLPRIVNTG